MVTRLRKRMEKAKVNEEEACRRKEWEDQADNAKADPQAEEEEEGGGGGRYTNALTPEHRQFDTTRGGCRVAGKNYVTDKVNGAKRP